MIDPREVAEAVSALLPERRPILHHEPWLTEREERYVVDALRTGGDGYARRLQEALKARCRVDCALAVSSGTAALHLALLALEVQPGEEVLVPASTFVATANAVRYVGAQPNFYDSGLQSSAFLLRQYLSRSTTASGDRVGRVSKSTGRRIKTLIIVHLLGVPSDAVALTEVARSFGLQVVEDACQALGASWEGRPCGSFGDVAALSFNCNKIATANGGGALLTDNPWLAARAQQLASVARVPHSWEVEHDAVAWNYRIPNINAALGLAQLERLGEILSAKRALAGAYVRGCTGVRGVSVGDGVPVNSAGTNHWLVRLELDPRCREDARERVLTELHGRGILARAVFKPLHRLPMYAECERSAGTMWMADSLWKRTICLPSGPELAPCA